jgi:hypothetical protein
MNSRVRAAVVGLFAAAFCLIAAPTRAQEAVVEEVRVEAAFTSDGLQLRRDPGVSELIERLRFRAEIERALELQKINESITTRLLNLSKFIPIPLGGSESRVDTFFLQNYMRPELNPPPESVLFRED